MIFIAWTISSYRFYKYFSYSFADFAKTVTVIHPRGLIYKLYWGKNSFPTCFGPDVESDSFCHSTSDVNLCLSRGRKKGASW